MGTEDKIKEAAAAGALALSLWDRFQLWRKGRAIKRALDKAKRLESDLQRIHDLANKGRK